jgi:DNA mismatch repair protein MutL
MPISILSEHTASRIAAGEVVERPASVVKELVENALDASARRISVEVTGGGVQSISVTDNGSGIAAGEVELAFQRFATSKIDDSSDLSGITTLGFRGEALPSIASVTHVEATSRTPESAAGVRLVLEFGRLVSSGPAGIPPGTTVRVTSLFKNTPARLKFLSSPGAELARIHRLLSDLALVNPGVAFTLTSDGDLRLASPGSGDRLAALAAVYGSKLAGQMLRIHAAPAAFTAEGLISAPAATRSSRGYITLAVNGRLVQSRRLAFAVEQAYAGYLPERRYPVAALNLIVPADDVDVNVHPAKTEVRLLREDLVFAELQRSIRAALAATSPARAAQVMGTPARQLAPAPGLSFAGPDNAVAAPSQFMQSPVWPGPPGAAAAAPAAAEPVTGAIGPLVGAAGRQAAPASGRQVLPVLRVIGQAHETYILAEGPDGLYLIDQHAAHERVMYEQLAAKADASAADTQALLDPEPVQLSPAQMAVVEQQPEALGAAGFKVEPFGRAAVLVRSVPTVLAAAGRQGSPGEWLARLLDEASDNTRASAWRERILATLACHASVRAGQTLSADEGRALIARLEATSQPHTCPHGRPTVIHLSSDQLERHFGRR